MRATRFFFSLLAFTLCFVALTLAQSSETGLPPFGSFHGSDFDLVSLKNGNLHVEIPIWSLPQRSAPNIGLKLVYDMPTWQVDKSHPTPTTTQWTVAPVSGEKVYWNYFFDPTGPVSTKHDIVDKTCSYTDITPAGPVTFTEQYRVHVNYVMTDSHGTKHTFNLRHVDEPGPPSLCADPNPTNTDVGLALDGSGYKADITSNRTFPQYQMANDIGQFNGNLGNELSTGGSTTVQTDANGVVLYRIDSVRDSDANLREFRVDYGPVTSLTNFCPLLPFQPLPSGTTCVETGSTLNLPQKLTLPTGKFYQFHWSTDGNADLLRIDLPTGGYISYTYESRLRIPPFQQGGIKQYQVRRRVSSRTVSDGALPPQTWQYLAGGIVHDPLGNEQVHTFGAPEGGADDDSSNYEVQVDFYQGTAASGTLLRTIKNDYIAESDPGLPDGIPHGTINARLIRTTTILGDAAQTQTKTETDYETLTGSDGTTYTFLNPIEKREYAYGAGAPVTLLRRTTYTYLHTRNQPYLDRNIVHRVLTTTVYDGSNHQAAKTVNEYDNYFHQGQPMVASGAIQHDDANYGTNFVYRGNVTAVSRWRSTDGAMLTTTNQYDDAGNLLSTIDPLGHKTSFDYTDSWGNTFCTPSGQAKVFATTVTNALSQTTTKSYNSCTATLASVTDANSKTTSYSYDPMNRLKTVSHPDSGSTTNDYDDTQRIVTSHSLITSTGAPVFSRRHYDQLGRVVQTELCEDGTAACTPSIKTDTTYDEIGQTKTVSNPYRSTTDSTYGITTNHYDGLGRVTQVTHQDGGVSTTNYDNFPTVTVTDPAGKQRRSITDALGLLIEVDEPGGAAQATPGSGSATVNGNSVQVYNLNAVAASGSVTIGGPGEQVHGATTASGSVNIQKVGSGSGSVNQPYWGCVLVDDGGNCIQWGWIDNWVTVYDSGSVQVGAGSCSKTTYYDFASAPNTSAADLASALVLAINADTTCVVSASLSGTVVNLTSKATGTAANYTIVASSSSTSGFSPPTFATSASGATLTGGQDGVYDSGTATITVNGVQKSVSYGQGSTSLSIAGALTTAITNDTSYPATATQNGATVNLTARIVGTVGNSYGLGGSTTYNSSTFSQPSFTASASGALLTGGVNGQVFYDSGTVSLTVAGCTPLTVNYQNGSSGSSVAAAMRTAVNSGGSCPVTASGTGSVVNVVSTGTGDGTNYVLSSSAATNDPQHFAAPSFTLSTAGMSGGHDPASLAAPAVTLYTYDTLGNLTCVEQHGNVSGTGCSADPSLDATSPWRVRRFTYNSLSQLLTAKNPESGSISYTYDDDGELLMKTSAAPNQIGTATQTISYCYDKLNRVTGKAYSAQSCTNGQLPAGSAAVSYFYDQPNYQGLTTSNGIGRLTGLSDQAGFAAYSFDPMGRIATEKRSINGASKTMSYEYNLDGSLKVAHYPSGAAVTYTPDLAGRTASAHDLGNVINYVTGATYAPAGLAGFVSGQSSNFAGITNAFSYDKRLQPTNMQATFPGSNGPVDVFDINYDFHLNNGDNGNVFAIINNRDNSRNQTFTYDALNRLASAQNAGTDCGQPTLNGKTKFWGNGYTYDAWGNLTGKGNLPGANSAKCNSESMDRTADAQNRLHVKPNTGADYQYDAAGNMTYNADAGQYYSYDPENRITGAGGFTYTYDADSNRVEKSTGANPPTGTLYWYMSLGVVAESDLNGVTQSEYIFFGGNRVARRDGVNGVGGVFYYFSDDLKSASVITDSAGVIKSDSDYYPWGGEMQFVNNDPNHYKFTAKERDLETGLDYFGARYYSNVLGRFITPDWAASPTTVPYAHFGNPQSLNLYGYVSNNPMTLNDPDGHGWFTDHLKRAAVGSLKALLYVATFPSGEELFPFRPGTHTTGHEVKEQLDEFKEKLTPPLVLMPSGKTEAVAFTTIVAALLLSPEGEEAKVIGLGLERDLAALEKGGALIYKDGGWQKAGLTRVNALKALFDQNLFMLSFKEAAAKADAIRFDVTHYDAAYPFPGLTKRELEYILNNKELLNKTTFIRDGKEVVWNGQEFVPKGTR
jgi:RHS repeat-associated protein